MATATADLISNVSRRLRDPSNVRHTAAEVLSVLNHCQRVLNFAKGSKLATNSAVVTAANRTLYENTDIHATDVQRIVAIRQEDRDLIFVPWKSLIHNDHRWLRRTGDRFELFSTIGRDLFVLYPALGYASTVEVTYVKAPATMVSGGQAPEVEDNLMPLLVDMAEVILSVKNKPFNTLPAILARIMVGFDMKEKGLHGES